MDKEGKNNKGRDFPHFMTMLLTIFFTTFFKRRLEEKFVELKGLPFIQDAFVYTVIFLICYVVFKKFTTWLYSRGN